MTRVVVIGAGLAGLAAARSLTELGMEVVVFEADSRVGGRTRTERDSFQEGQHANMGASFIDLGQHRILRLCQELELEITPGFSLHPRRADGSPAGKADILRNHMLLDGGLVPRADVEAIATEVEQAIADRPAGPVETMTAWSRRVGLSEPASKAFCALAGLNPVDQPWRTPAAVWTEVPLGDIVWMFRDGTDSLARRLAEQLDVRLAQPVRAVRVGRGGATVETDASTLECSHVVVAVSLRAVLQIAIEPALPDWKVAAIQAVPVSQGGKVANQYTDGAYLAEQLREGVLSDGPVTFAWASPRSTGDKVIVTGLVPDRGDGLLGRHEDLANSLDEMVRKTVGDRPQRIASAVQDWASEAPFYGVVSMIIGRRRELISQLATAVGRVHFAGEYSSPVWPSGMEGALWSGTRAAREIALDEGI